MKMSKSLKLTGLIFLILALISCRSETGESSYAPEFSSIELLQHIRHLSSDEMNGRLAGSPDEAKSAAYIAELFDSFGLIPASLDGRFYQFFELEGPMVQAAGMEGHMSRNVLGYVRGGEFPQQWVVVGAHYDGQGTGGFISMDGGTTSVHNSADDNASGVAGLLELAHYYSANPADYSILFIAFSGEELGLLGSRFFIESDVLSRDSIVAMINLDMTGRLEDGLLTISGVETAPFWEESIQMANRDSINIETKPTGSGASDHIPFKEAGIPAIHYFTGLHDDYHRSSDTFDKVDAEGILKILDHISLLVEEIPAEIPVNR